MLISNKIYIGEIFLNIVYQYKKLYNIDLSYMNYKLTDKCEYNDGRENPNWNKYQWIGSWTKLKYIVINKYYDEFMNKLNIKNKKQFMTQIIAHELAHEIYSNKDDKFKKDIINTAKKEKFTTEYLETVNKEKYDQELFCEYLANQISKRY